jgi:hypothetical protein
MLSIQKCSADNQCITVNFSVHKRLVQLPVIQRYIRWRDSCKLNCSPYCIESSPSHKRCNFKLWNGPIPVTHTLSIQFKLMPGPVREAYNAKGRQSTAGSRKKGKIRKDKTQKNGPQEDSNADILTPESKEEKETAKKKKLLEEVQTFYFFKKLLTKPFSQLAAQSEGKWTSKKRKRLEKYIVSSKIHCGNFRGGNPFVLLIGQKAQERRTSCDL